jgi:hypothetical protein
LGQQDNLQAQRVPPTSYRRDDLQGDELAGVRSEPSQARKPDARDDAGGTIVLASADANDAWQPSVPFRSGDQDRPGAETGVRPTAATEGRIRGLRAEAGRAGPRHSRSYDHERSDSEAESADPSRQRDRHIAMISADGRMKWQSATGYSKRSLVEIAFGRYKSLLRRRLRARSFSALKTERPRLRAPHSHTSLPTPEMRPLPDHYDIAAASKI